MSKIPKIYRNNPQERILNKISIDEESSCWNWIGCVQSNGYSRVRLNNTSMGGHRASYILFIGAIPKNMDVCHKCDNRKCVNPDHLFLGDRKANMQDAVSKNRHARGFMLPHTKLSKDDILNIVSLKDLGIPTKEIAIKYSVCKQHVNKLYRESKKCAV